MSIVISILAALIVLSILVAVHEGGHFLAGKLLGFRILEFSIGMGPRLLKKEKNGTIYSLRAFPIGGMCAFDGEDEEAQSEQSFNSFPAWKRFLVAFAGPFMNIVLAFVLAIILMLIFGSTNTMDMTNPVVSEFSSENTPAQAAGIQPGDMVIRIDDTQVFTADEMINAITKDEDGSFTVTVLRPTEHTSVLVNGEKVSEEELSDINAFVKAHPAESYTISYDNATELTLSVKDAYNETEKRNMIGASIYSAYGFYDKEYNIITAIPAGVNYVSDVMRQMYEFLGSLFSGGVRMQDMSGIVGIVDVVNDGVSTVINDEGRGSSEKVSTIVEFLFYVAVLLSINLGIINLLPLPALDGGRIVFNIIEMIARRPIPAKIEGTIHTVGLILLLLLIAVITVKDVIFLF